MQLHKPADESKVIYRKTVITTENGNNRANNEHSFANKMKEMANGATRLFHHTPNGEVGGGHYQVHQSGTRITSNTPHANATHMHMQEKKKKENMMTSCTGGKKKKQHENVIINGIGRKEEKHGGAGGAGFLANMEGQVKNFTHKVEGKGKNKSKSEGHDSSSDSSSDDDCRSKKK